MNTQINGVKHSVNNPVLLWSKRKLWTVRLVLLALLGSWFAIGFYLHHQVVQNRTKLEQQRIETARHNEFLRRGAQYRQDLQQRTGTPRVRNAFDGK